ncbi:MAG: thiamine-phosphate kinase [Candidatus Gastranaerophilales bacterium]|nr:thiamine-phosphate kinase [Candidatus Gastranaerophilales bacterium]
MKEFDFLKIIKNELPQSARYIGDDTAYIEEKDLIISQDTLVENVHFRSKWLSPYELGRKSVAINLSDIAADGGIPEYILISLSLPTYIDEDFIKAFYKGVNGICQEYRTVVIGGDLTGGEKITVSITILGKTAGFIPARRTNANIGNKIIVTGEFGSSSAGLWLLENKTNEIPMNTKEYFIEQHKNPVPQINIGRKIAQIANKPFAMMDSSDGLADALWQISNSSNVGMQINFEKIPFNKKINAIANLAQKNYVDWIFYGGEDYQLIACVDDECIKNLIENNVKFFEIGHVTDQKDVKIIFDDKEILIDENVLNQKGFNHFSL